MRRRRWVGAMLSALLLVSCSGGEDEVATELEIERLVARGDNRPLGDSLVASGDHLLGINGARFGSSSLVVSDDLGRSWRAVDLPRAPDELALSEAGGNPLVGGGVTVVAGADAAPASDVYPVAQSGFYLWTSTDLKRWTVDLLDTDAPLTGPVEMARFGGAFLASVDSTAGQNLYTSSDEGRTWRRGLITGPLGVGTRLDRAWTSEGELRLLLSTRGNGPVRRYVLVSRDQGDTWAARTCGATCSERLEAGSLRARGPMTSTERGPWRPISVDPAPPEGSDDPPSIDTLTAVPGGWLATATSPVPSDVSYGQLLRSVDGRRWRQALPADPCVTLGESRPNSAVGTPTRFDDAWFVTYSCAALSTPVVAMVYSSDASAKIFAPVRETRRRRVSYADPVLMDDLLLIPESDDDEDRLLSAVTVIS
ncbi:MAG: sialidase family protein [Acidimicrobiales bacterium]